MRPSDLSKPIPIAQTKRLQAADLRAEVYRMMKQADQIDREVIEAEEREFEQRCNGAVVRIVCDMCFGTGCDACAESGFNYRVRFQSKGRHSKTLIHNTDEIRDALLSETWRSNDGREMAPKDFDNGHLVNTVKFIRRERFQFGRPRIYDLLLAEMKARELDPNEHYSSIEETVQHDIDEL